MIADTTFLIHLVREQLEGISGPARTFLVRHRTQSIRTTIISIGEVASGFHSSADAWQHFKRWKIYHLHRGVVDAAADLDRFMFSKGHRLGENDNWIAGFCLYYREPLISLDAGFDRVPQLRRLLY
jgi:predicted nucleic acid-binding protein